MKNSSLTLDLFCDGTAMPQLPWPEWEERHPDVSSEPFYHQVKRYPSLSFCRLFETKNIRRLYELSSECMEWLGPHREQFPPGMETVWTVAHFFDRSLRPLSLRLSGRCIHFLHEMGFKFDYSIYPGACLRGRRKTGYICLSFKGNAGRREEVLSSCPRQGREILVEMHTKPEPVTGIFFYGESLMSDLRDFLNHVLHYSEERGISWQGARLNLDYFPLVSYSGLRLCEDTIEILSRLRVSLGVTIHTPDKLCSREYPLFPLVRKFNRHLREIRKELPGK